MCRIRTCCGCCDLAVGVFVVCGFTIAVSCLGLISLGIGLYGVVTTHHYYGLDVEGPYEGPLTGVMSGGIGLLALWLLSAVLMVIGNVQKRKNMYVAWMVMTSIVVLLLSLGLMYGIYCFAVYVGYSWSFVHKYPGAVVGALGINFVYALLWIYALVVVGSHHSELRRREEQDTQPLIDSPPPYAVKTEMA